MTFKKLILAGAILAAPLMMAKSAEARDYCREYQKSIRVGGHIESGYGTACMQPDGSWMIVESRGTVDPFDELRRDNNVIIVSDQRPIYYNYGPRFQPVTYYPRPHYRPARYSGTSFFFNFGDDDRRDRHWNNNRWDRHDRHDRWDRHDRNDHRGRGRGHDRD